jgi:hypothetical protein
MKEVSFLSILLHSKRILNIVRREVATVMRVIARK